MLVYLIILICIVTLLFIIQGKYINKNAEIRLLMALPTIVLTGYLVYSANKMRENNLNASVVNFVKHKRGELSSCRRVTSDGKYRRSTSQLTDINTYLEVELKDGRCYIVGFTPEFLGDYFGSLYEVREFYRNHG